MHCHSIDVGEDATTQKRYPTVTVVNFCLHTTRWYDPHFTRMLVVAIANYENRYYILSVSTYANDVTLELRP